MSTTERYYTLSTVCLIVECIKRQRKGNKKKNNIQIVVCRIDRKRIERSVLLLLFIQRTIIIIVIINTAIKK